MQSLVQAIDLSRAKVMLDSDEDPEDLVIVRMKELYIDNQVATGLKMFRLQDYSSVIVVSEQVREKMTNISGVSIYPADGWGDSRLF